MLGSYIFKALVTGGARFIGSNICRKLVSLGWFVRVVDTLIAKLLGKSIKPTYTAERAGDVKYSSADIGLAKKVIGFEPVVPFNDGMANVIDWYRKTSVG